MKVYKFGGASVKDAENVKNVAKVLHTAGYNNTVIVISAMGKTTNALEEVVEAYFSKNDYIKVVEKVKKQHLDIAKELFSEGNQIFEDIDIFFSDIISFLRRNKSPHYNFVYDQVVCCGELISTKIVSTYLNSIGIENTWLDVRDYVKADNKYREGKINWTETLAQFENFDKNKVYVTQGFLAADSNFFSVTLGREGSDYSAAIVAYCVDAESMTIWKDVPGVLNADPRYFKDAQLLNAISYEEAIELAFYGASVIHPKTMQPLLRKEIPFYVRSFMNPEAAGTTVRKGTSIEPKLPCYILKKDEHLLNVSSKDFSFMQEENISFIFGRLSAYNIKVNLIRVSAISLSLCLEDKFNNLEFLIKDLENIFNLDIENNVSLYTIRHSNPEVIKNISEGKNVLLEQMVKDTYQMVVK